MASTTGRGDKVDLWLNFSHLALGELASEVPKWTLASKMRVPEWPYEETELVATVRRAWEKPLSELTGYEFGTLVSQGFALEWIAPHAIEVARRYPNAEIASFEGDLTYALLRYADEVHQLQPELFRHWRTTDVESVADLAEPPDEEESYLDPSFQELLTAVRQRYS